MASKEEAKIFHILENNPEVMNALGKKLGLSDEVAFYDVLSLDEPALLAEIPRPAYALLAILAATPQWLQDRQQEDERLGDPSGYYSGGKAGAGDEPVIWFEQTIREACGSYGLVHCAINGAASKYIVPGSTLEQLRNGAIPLGRDERARLLYDNMAFEEAHELVASLGDTSTPALGDVQQQGQHFVAFVKANGHLWELEGSRQGPLDRGPLGEDEDVLSPRALELGVKRIIELERDPAKRDVRFSCTVLAAASHLKTEAEAN